MYGPPPDPRQVYAPTGIASEPGAWLACLLIGLVLAWAAGTKRPFLFIVGCTLALTTPFGAFATTYVWGQFPTIDKAGSLLFYLDGVMWRFWDPTDPAIRLIGVHVGHLWITGLFDLLVSSTAAFNLQAFLNLVLGWYCAWLLLNELSGDREVSLVFAFPFGMGLHLFRDINWYTIEKSGVYWVPLYAWALVKAYREGGRWVGIAALIYVATLFYNFYLGVLCAGIGAMALLTRKREVWLAVGASALAALPLVALQLLAMRGDGALGDPETFLTQRAALDIFELWPPKWNRLEAWRALNVVALALAAVGFTRRKNLWIGGVALAFFLLALGPAHNPVYRLLFELVPGFWRIAKPETFFHVTWLALLAVAARVAADARPSRPAVAMVGLLFALSWAISIRTHPVYPRFTQPLELTLSEDWERALPAAPRPRSR
ncbi:MAG: hypothetical protein Q8P18_11320 [Pseudomonadota bacterium]|nr:hypothetical protein [Pseudomonadota bacterium]